MELKVISQIFLLQKASIKPNCFTQKNCNACWCCKVYSQVDCTATVNNECFFCMCSKWQVSGEKKQVF